jgi:DNA-binding response OmpR family regulator
VREANGVAIFVGSESLTRDQVNAVVALARAAVVLADPKAEFRAHAQGMMVPATSSIVAEMQRELVFKKTFADRGVDDRPVVFDLAHRIVRVNGIPKRLPPTEVRILETLMSVEGFVFRRELSNLMYPGKEAAPLSTISTLVLRIRKKLDAYADIIQSGKNTGYRFDHTSPHVLILNPGKVN